MNRALLFIFFIAFFSAGFAQEAKKDSVKTLQMNEVVVTATKTSKQISDLPLPVTVVDKNEIKSTGALRLNEILGEQTGLNITSDFGKGIQVQGLDPQYTLILIDGEPVIGRLAGNLNLSRITLKNVKQVEILKGPMSALYGTDALAGVINLVTNDSSDADASSSVQYGSNQTLDVSADAMVKAKKTRMYFFADRNSSDGYDFYPSVYGYTSNPYTSWSFRTKLTHSLSDKSKISLSGNYNNEIQTDNYQDSYGKIDGEIKKTEWNLNPVFTYRKNAKLKITAKSFTAHYTSSSEYVYSDNGILFDEDAFEQTYLKPELQADYAVNNNNYLISGIGRTDEWVSSNRYTDSHHFSADYFFIQYQWTGVKRLNVMAGARVDAHSEYKTQLNPKVSLQYELCKSILLRASAGRGYKTPDLRQLYLNFYNPIVGYNVFGVYELADGIAELQQQGQIAALLVEPGAIGNIRPESSVALNGGFVYKPGNKFKAEVNFFRNDLTDLIETQLIARKTNGQFVYSYTNLSKIYTQGFDADARFKLSALFSISAGYELLYAIDKSVVNDIEDGKVFRRNPTTLLTEKVKPSEYGGLFNRSQHSGNLKFGFVNFSADFTANVRLLYKGRYGYADLNGNSILDADNEYVEGYWLVNAGISKSFSNKKFEVGAGVDNITDFKNIEYIPAIPGRLWHVSFIMNFNNTK